jgi:type IV pilus assembly protein PilE
MIVLVIVGILTMIAYPSYNNYILKSHRPDAFSALARDQTIIERCYAQNFSYSATCASLPNYPHNSSQNYYAITLTNQTTSTYTLTATTIGPQTVDTTCQTIAVNQANQKTASDSSGNTQTTCWGQ